MNREHRVRRPAAQGEETWARTNSAGLHWVLLAAQEQRIEPALLEYAVNLCRRMQAGLEILLIAAEGCAPPPITECFQRLQAEGIGHVLNHAQGRLGEAVLRHVKQRHGIVLVLIDSLASWDTQPGAPDREPWNRLACPLVVADGGWS